MEAPEAAETPETLDAPPADRQTHRPAQRPQTQDPHRYLTAVARPHLAAARQPAHDQVLVFQTVVLLLLVPGCLGPAGPLEASEGGPAGLGVEGVHHDGLRALDLTAAERAALTLRLLTDTGESKLFYRHMQRSKVTASPPLVWTIVFFVIKVFI